MKKTMWLRGKTGMAALVAAGVLLLSFGSFAATADSLIGKEKATSIALSDAGLKAEDVVMEKCKLDKDDGVRHYNVEFYGGGYEYDYEIHAKTGKILEREKEKDDDWSKHGKTKRTVTYIGKAKAKAIALEHAGVAEKDARFDKVKLERDDGKMMYKVEFDTARCEYEYEIHATSGKILESEKDGDDHCDHWDDCYDDDWDDCYDDWDD